MENLIDEAKKENIKYIIGSYIPTKKNDLVKNFLAECGFAELSKTEEETKYKLDLDDLGKTFMAKDFFTIVEN